MSSKIQTVHHFSEIDFERPGKSLYEVAFHYDGTWGNAMVPLAIINGKAGPGRAVACFGGTHGNEHEGQIALWRLLHELDPTEMYGRLIIIPRLNQPACVAVTRPSPLDGVNMNRAFPGDASGSITYRIADFVTRYIFPLVDTVIDLHAAGRGAEFAICTSIHKVADEAQFVEMGRVASLFDTPFVFVYSSEMASGLLTDQAEEMGKIAIGGEFGHSEGVSPDGLRHAYQGVRNVLHDYGMLPGTITKVARERTERPKLVAAIHLNDYVPAPFSGSFAPEFNVGQAVTAGQIVGYLYDFQRLDQEPQVVRAPQAGYILMQAFQAPIHKGDTILVVAQKIP